MKKFFALLLILLTQSPCVRAQNHAESFKKMEWLIGNWQGEGDGMPFYESWAKNGETEFLNVNYTICGGRVVESERSKIQMRNGEILYGENHKLTSLTDAEVVFENSQRGERFTFQHTKDGKWIAKLQYPRTAAEYTLNKVPPASELTKTKPKPLIGRYSGYLEFQGKRLQTAIDFEERDGEEAAFVSTPDNLQLRMPVQSVCYNPPFIGISLSENNQTLRFGGKIENDTISGKVASRELPASLVLTKDTSYKPPKPPYLIETVSIVNGETKLAANLYLPSGKDRAPAVIMVAGTGQRTKEEYNGWADLLASKGFAVLTYDKRNVTNFPSLNIRNPPTDIGSIDNLAEDAAQAFRLLKRRSDINPRKIGLVGFSQGAVVVPIVAANNPEIAFVVAISGNTTTDREFIINQALNRLRARRADEATLKKAEDLMNKLFAYAKTRSDSEALQKELETAHSEGWGRVTVPRAVPNDDELKHVMTWNSFELDPASYWARVNVPVFLIYGERDELIPVRRSVEIINRVYGDRPNRLTVKVYPNANHMIKNLPRTQSFEWAKFADGYLETLIAWLEQKGNAN